MKRVFLISFLITLMAIIAIEITGTPLVNNIAPGGIVSFELAGSIEMAQKILNSWNAKTRIYAGFNLGLDYLFLVAYSLSIFSGLMLVREAFFPEPKIIRQILGISAWLQFLAGLLDAVENYALIKLLFGSQSGLLPVVAKNCAIVKFSLVGWGLLLLIFSLLFYFLFGRRRHAQV